MSTPLSAYMDNTTRLALGLDLVDAAREMELVYPVRVDVEYGLPHSPPSPAKVSHRFTQVRGKLPVALNRHTSGRYSLIYQPSLKTEIDLRIYEYERRYVPRRLQAPLMTLDDVLALEIAEPKDYYSGRVRQPVLFPGAAYPMRGKTTGLVGRVLRDDESMRWTHVEARMEGGQLVGLTRGDDRGEFLLIIESLAASASDLSAEINITVTVFGPAAAPIAASADLAAQDDLWDLPLEILPAIGDPDSVSTGVTPPTGYVAGASATIAFKIGRMLTGVEVDDFVFTPP